MLVRRSSNGCRSTSSTCRLNSGSSSRNSKPWCARDTFPRLGIWPPPIWPTSEIVWCGPGQGRVVRESMPQMAGS
jgi:hypothetical protein